MRLINAEPLIALMEIGKDSLDGNTEFGKGMIAALSMDIMAVKDAPTIEQLRWIPVTERLPKSRIAVLGALLWDTIDIVWYDKDDGVWQNEFVNAYAEGEVTHWMPLPQPPKGDE